MHKDQLSVGLGRSVIRIAIALAAAGALAAGCGGGGGGGNQEPVGPVSPGFFVGATHQNNPMSVRVTADAVDGVFVTCGGGDFDFQKFIQPPAPIAADDTFSVTLVDDAHLRTVVVSGLFENQGSVTGTITGDPFCEGDFALSRCPVGDLECGDADSDLIPDGVDPDKGGRVTPTPTPTQTVTPLPTKTPTPTGETSTPTAATPTPTATKTPEANLCGNGQVDSPEQCDPGGSEPDLDGESCDTLCDANQSDTATLKCSAACKFDFSSCTEPSSCSPPS